MLSNISRWSHAHGNEVVPSRWQATDGMSRMPDRIKSRHALIVKGSPTECHAVATCDDPPQLEVRDILTQFPDELLSRRLACISC